MNASTNSMKKVNKDLVRRQLMELKRATKHELAMRTGLSVVTLQSLLSEMIVSHQVYEGELVPSGGGRPSVEYCFNGEYAHAVVVFGFQKKETNYIKILTVNLYGEKVLEREVFLKEVEIDSFDEYLEEALEKFPHIRGIGFGLPGEIQGERITVCDYQKLVGTEFIEYIKSAFALPIIVLNDVNAAIVGFTGSKELMQDECSVGLYFPRIFSPGAGVVIGGQIYTGKNNFAGELGFLSLGTDWIHLDYEDQALITEKIGCLLSFYCCILAPHHIIIYGDFLNKSLQQQIRNFVTDSLQNQFTPDIHISSKFEEDYENGMIYEILTAIENNDEIIHKGVSECLHY